MVTYEDLYNTYYKPINDTYMLIDWFQFTIKKLTEAEVIPLIFPGYTKNDFQFTAGGLNGYNKTLTLGHKMHVMWNEENANAGVNILFSGSACREYEELFLWTDLFKTMKELDDKGILSVNRIDIAIDYLGKDFTVKSVQKKVDNEQYTSRFRSVMVQYELDTSTNERLGEMVQFGKKVSDLHIVFYNKKKERENAGYEVDEKTNQWVRCELRFRHDQAQGLFKKLVEIDKPGELGKTIKGILRRYLSFKVGDYSGDKAHKCRAEECKWWIRFTSKVPKLRIEKQSRSTSIAKKQKYVDKSLSKMITMLAVCDQETFIRILESGKEKINKYDLSLINEHLMLQNKQILTYEDMYHFIDEYVEKQKSKK